VKLALEDTSVLIAGAGPVGLALAAELKRLGVTALVVDRQAATANTSRACVVHARTLEVLEALGVVPDMLAQGVKVPFFRARDRDRALITLDFRRIPSTYCFTLMCPQDRTEAILLTRLEQLGGRVLRETEVVQFEENADEINVRLKDSSGSRSVRTRWLVGCDGMHSIVREQANIAFVGAAYQESFILADVHMDWPLSREEVTLFFSPDGFMVVSPLPDERFRIVATVDEGPELPSAPYVQSLLDNRGPSGKRGTIKSIVWSSRFKIHHRVASSPRKGRILLCGDAAHAHSPAGGQGMNTGIQDSISLAQVLSQTLKDGAQERLDDWATQRHRIATDVVAFTDRMTRMATLKSGTGKALRNMAIALMGHLPPVRTALASNLAEIGRR
jgi:2-polyprenyl-6-methoxyphenol hydroxylase-like FAD-dependent oxidoreductase